MKLLRCSALIASALTLSAWRAHPIHAARVELDVTSIGTVNVVLHVYRDDFPRDTTLPAVTSYLINSLAITDVRGARVPLRATAVVPEGDRLRINLSGGASAALSRGRIAVTLLQDRYPDQVNVVDARILGHHAQLLFLRGDPAQVLP